MKIITILGSSSETKGYSWFSKMKRKLAHEYFCGLSGLVDYVHINFKARKETIYIYVYYVNTCTESTQNGHTAC